MSQENKAGSGKNAGGQLSVRAAALAAIGRDNSMLEKDRDSWRDACRKWQYVAAGFFVVAAVQATGIFKQEAVYFGQVTDGRNTWVVPLMNLKKPVVQRRTVINFAAEAAALALSHSFASWRADLSRIDDYFLPEAAVQLKEGLAKTRFFQRLEETTSVTTAVPKSAPVVIAEQELPDSYGWKLKLTMTVTWQGPVQKSEDVTIEMVVRQVQPMQNPRGVLVERINIG